MSDFSDLEEIGSDSSGSFFGSEFAEERIDFPPPLVLPPLPDNRGRSGSVLRLTNRVWIPGERRMERLLVGQFLDRRHFSTRDMQLLVNELWHTRQPVLVVARNDNAFVFRFYAEEDLAHAYSRGPWLIRGGLLVLDYWHLYDALSQIRVRRFAIWVQLHNLPFEAFTREAGEIMGQALGDEVTVDIDDVFPRQFRYLRVCVTITPETTLVPGFFLDIPGGQPRWIECRYERLYRFCRSCGRIGHTYPQCDLSQEEARARVDAMLNRVCEHFGTTMHVEEDVPLYTNRLRAFSRSNARRNTHMWAVRYGEHGNREHEYQGEALGEDATARRFGLNLEQVDGTTHTIVGEVDSDISPVAVDFDQFLEDYDAAWDWGMQQTSPGVFQRGNYVVIPASPGGGQEWDANSNVHARGSEENVSQAEGNQVDGGESLESAVGELSWIVDGAVLTVETVDRRWLEWEGVLRRFGVNPGRWEIFNEVGELVMSELRGQDDFTTDLMEESGLIKDGRWDNNDVGVECMVASLGLEDAPLLLGPGSNRPLVIREPVVSAGPNFYGPNAGFNGLALGWPNAADSKGKRLLDEGESDSDSSDFPESYRRYKRREVLGPDLVGCSHWIFGGNGSEEHNTNVNVGLDLVDGVQTQRSFGPYKKVKLYKWAIHKAARRVRWMRKKGGPVFRRCRQRDASHVSPSTRCLLRASVGENQGYKKRRGRLLLREIGPSKRRSVSSSVSSSSADLRDNGVEVQKVRAAPCDSESDEILGAVGSNSSPRKRLASQALRVGNNDHGEVEEHGLAAIRQRVTVELHQVVWDKAIAILSEQLRDIPVADSVSSSNSQRTVWDEYVENLQFQIKLAEELRQYVWERCAFLAKGDGDSSKNGVSEEVGPHQPPPSP
ncbi:hypothetical protein Vadar_010107 [Vaccinium darrowii]|nr:hypothetical protein Vadar_010107 [Vaccinium darrowii]